VTVESQRRPGTLGEALRRATKFLERKGVPSPRVDAEHLLGKALGLSRVELYRQHDRPLGDDELGAARALLERRGRREPLAYILGEWGFRRLSLKVDARGLIPRPETEVVVERCLEHLRDHAEPKVVDVGTGSGAIALAIADEHPGARVTALDASPDALALARENAERTGLAGRVEFVQGDISAGLPGASYSLVVSNPPYVRPDEIEGLQPEVRDWEPRQATVGTGVTEAVARAAREALEAGGWLVLEIADGTADAVCALVAGLGFAETRSTPDLAGRDRVVEGRWA
jgi:release factor glutamine methyltransferase